MPRDLLVPAVLVRSADHVKRYFITRSTSNITDYIIMMPTIPTRWTKGDCVWCKFPTDIWYSRLGR